MIDFGFDLAGRKDPRLTRGAIFSALSAVTEALPLGVAFVVLDGVLRGGATWAWLPWVTGVLVLSVVLTSVLKSIGGTDSFTATYGQVCAARLRLADHLRRLPMGFWTAQRTGSVSSVLTDEFALYTEIVTHVWFLMVSTLAKTTTIALVMMIADWRLGAVALVTLPIALATVPWSYRLVNRASERLIGTKVRAHSQLVEFAQGATTLREYGKTDAFHRRLEEVLQELEAEQMRTELAPAPALFTYKLVVWLGFSLLIGLGAYLVAEGAMEATRFLLLALLALPLAESASELSNHMIVGRFAARTLDRIRALFEEKPQTDVGTENEGATPSGSIVVEDVTFAYADRPAVSNIDAVFKEGTVTALVGPSGSGKSTLAHLLARIWDIDEGRIALGGMDLREMSLATLRAQVATVFQDVVLFQETVEENIRLGRPDASREEVIEAAKAAEAHAFITALPDGYDTVLGEGGDDLSGGQRQRLSIARALLKDAPVLILDEATSSVDSHNERLIQSAIRRLTTGRTVVVIAHRLWTVQHADAILVLDQGGIVERGTHAELMAAEGLYHRLWRMQSESRRWRLGVSLAALEMPATGKANADDENECAPDASAACAVVEDLPPRPPPSSR